MTKKNEASENQAQCAIQNVIAPLVIGCLTITPFEDDDYLRITIEGVYEDQTELIHKKHLDKLKEFFTGL